MCKQRAEQRGFTIVELLIVIVVIGILAAITIVAYSGINKRAQFASVQSDVTNASKKIEIYRVDSSNYPVSITDCPTPAAANICLPPSSGNTYSYSANNAISPQTYEIRASNSGQFYYMSAAEKTGVNEFLQYTDLAPIIDAYGLIQYKLTFNIKSASIASQATANVYMQNGSGAKYGGLSVNVPVTTSYVSQTVTFTASLADGGLTQSILAFYGTYGTGNILSVKDMKIQRQ